MSTDDCIVATATPLGMSALALIRLSGHSAISVVAQLNPLAASLVPRRATLLTLSWNGETLDETLVTLFAAPASYTGENLIEITPHGNPLIVRRIVEACLVAGARMARPGEFSMRAFMNGKMDLTQAESVMDLIAARTELALRSARASQKGHLRSHVNSLRETLLDTLAHIEAHIDFPDEDIQPDTRDKLRAQLEERLSQISKLLSTSETGRILREGVRTVIVGLPNTGKSSLLNALLGENRAIVHNTPGTTRDTLEEWLCIEGVPIRIIDTAGTRDTTDPVEQEGVRRSGEALATAELVIHLFDLSSPWDAAQQALRNSYPADRAILVGNKSDLPEKQSSPPAPSVAISALTGAGLDTLKKAIVTKITSGFVWEEGEVTINARHRDCLMRASTPLRRACDGLREGHSLEIVSLELRESLQALTEIVGVISNEEILDKLFSGFCIGK